MARSPEPALDDDAGRFHLRVPGFTGPFDLLLSLIAKRELDVTEVALSAVTDEFLAHLASLPTGDDLEQASGFLVVGATLLDAKLAGLLPQGDVVDAEGVAQLEARDLLFARLLQYRAYRESVAWFAERLAAEALRHPRTAGPDPSRMQAPSPGFALDAVAFAALAASALVPAAPPAVATGHLHAPAVSLREQAAIVAALLRDGAARTFLQLADDASDAAVVVVRFLAVLELYRHGALVFEQVEPLGTLVLRWSATDWTEEALTALGGDWDG